MARSNYIGRAGQLAVMAEFLLRGYNVSIPEVDEGDDIFVVNNPIEELWRIQVKTAIGVERGYGFSGQFQVPREQLETDFVTPLFYIFAIRCRDWWEFLPMSQEDLLRECGQFQVGTEVGASIVLYLAFKATEVICSNRNWQAYRNNWTPWPILFS